MTDEHRECNDCVEEIWHCDGCKRKFNKGCILSTESTTLIRKLDGEQK